ncbi:PREDICTED: uncharacterized protein LOC105449952 [Wasmannia auropunctata]|uniref:uncharacterized protein LOC105449952 n=1 Tax=Wasmannia auropunctata TaxID=64793 RepID=UPI0005ED9ED5|nr:PREDICTED: uncharacterized protein LOC105449952 [Wasmannia auropunctata]XP_011687742.1 PREDICTED: uncharacterized protein LOC105449952 [Wasmannia auropunctata]XP_011687743.1 PREDICTED: uncharacterized protein LOC105449952 [Wasmannia auropunctata]XP_011687744.1 PREDICTED: uncharacterized protein LOC105449952 [Wasmannia auropunctata]
MNRFLMYTNRKPERLVISIRYEVILGRRYFDTILRPRARLSSRVTTQFMQIMDADPKPRIRANAQIATSTRRCHRASTLSLIWWKFRAFHRGKAIVETHF